MTADQYRLLADLVLVIHVGIVIFVVLGLVLTLVGGVRGWTSVRNPWFRLTHLAAIGVVVLQAWGGRLCPLTIWEDRLRTAAGQSGYETGFVAHWLRELLFYEGPLWVFGLAYTVFGALVGIGWWLFPPRAMRRNPSIVTKP